MANTSYLPVADFYNHKSVFITGGTGFVGKVILEKLLYSCTKLDNVYVMIRPKKSIDIERRLQNIFDNALFTRIKESNPHCLDKVVPIYGDITLPRLGLSVEDENTLIEKVSVIIHSAATIKLKEPLAVAMNINLEGTQKMLELCKRINNMQAFVHISTVYAQSDTPVISEVIYPAPAKLKDVYNFIKENGHNKQETLKFINKKPDTYTFSKALAESYIAENHGHVPTVIVRPSAVASAKEEPISGWIDSWFGAAKVIYDIAKGWNHINLGSETCIIDLIPVDYVSNLCIVAATTAHKSKEVQVFNIGSSGINPITAKDLYNLAVQEYVRKGYHVIPYFTSVFFSKSIMIVKLLTIILLKIPAYIADIWLKAKREQPKYEQMMSMVIKARDAIVFFSSRSWIIKNEQSRKLFSVLSPEDQMIFPCDPINISWPDYVKDYLNGIYQYLKP